VSQKLALRPDFTPPTAMPIRTVSVACKLTANTIILIHSHAKSEPYACRQTFEATCQPLYYKSNFLDIRSLPKAARPRGLVHVTASLQDSNRHWVRFRHSADTSVIFGEMVRMQL
jgi:hypothetical protein